MSIPPSSWLSLYTSIASSFCYQSDDALSLQKSVESVTFPLTSIDSHIRDSIEWLDDAEASATLSRTLHVLSLLLKSFPVVFQISVVFTTLTLTVCGRNKKTRKSIKRPYLWELLHSHHERLFNQISLKSIQDRILGATWSQEWLYWHQLHYTDTHWKGKALPVTTYPPPLVCILTFDWIKVLWAEPGGTARPGQPASRGRQA